MLNEMIQFETTSPAEVNEIQTLYSDCFLRHGYKWNLVEVTQTEEYRWTVIGTR